MAWMPPHVITAFQEERRLQKQWQLCNVKQGIAGAKENRMQIKARTLVQTQSVVQMPKEVAVRRGHGLSGVDHKDLTVSNQLFPGIAVVYKSTFRYAQAHEDLLTVDMFDASVETHSTVRVLKDSVFTVTHGSRPFETRSLMPDEIPQALQGKLATLEIVRSSLCTTPTMCVHVPDVGIVFGTGVKWVILTKEDCDGN